MRKRVIPILLVLSLVGCPESSNPDAGITPGTDAPIAPGTDAPIAPGTDAPIAPGTDAPIVSGGSDTISFGPDPLAAGDERTVCVVLDAGNDVARQVRAIHTDLPTGSHHMIVYRTDAALNPTPTPCSPFADGANAVFIAETRSASLTYPSDAALAFDAHQHIRVEVHEVNYTASPIDIRASVTFDYYPLDSGTRSPVQFLFTGETSLFLPARMSTTVESFHGVPPGARIFGLTSHTHGLGTYASIHRGTSASTYTALLHESLDWSDPPLDTFAPPLVLDAGEGLRLSCEYDNTRADPVGFGLDFNDEMCFLWAYYY